MDWLKAGICCSIAALWSAPTLAQDAEENPSDKGRIRDDNVIIVTAQKRSESAQDIPVTVTAISGETLADRGIVDFDHAEGTLIEEYVILDANITYRSPNERFSIALWGRNLTDTFSYALLLGPTVPGPGLGIPRPPRTYGIRAGFDF